jgi:ABC-type polysaccharide/polyol phosphate export permease
VASAPPTARASFDTWGAFWTLVRTDFVVRYHGTVQGFFWALLKPLAMFSALAVVFSFIFSAKQQYAVNLLVGLTLYEYFAEGTKTGLASMLVKGFLISKSTFPRWLIVVASTVNPLLNALVMSLGLLVYLAVAGPRLSLASVGLYVWYFAHLIAMVVAFSLAASPIFLRYRDLNQIWEVAAQAGFFLTPVIYPIAAIPERFHFYLYLWPPTAVIQFSRAVLVAGELPSLKAHLLLTGGTLVCVLACVAVFRSLQARAAEYL